MTPEQKAKELVDKFKVITIGIIHTDSEGDAAICNGNMINYDAVQCAIICVGELILEHTFTFPRTWNSERKEYWESVRNHLTNI